MGKLDIVFGNDYKKKYKVNEQISNNLVVNSELKYQKAEIPAELKGDEYGLNVPIKKGEEFREEKAYLENVKSRIKKKIRNIQDQPTYVNRYATVRGGDDGTEFAQLRSYKSASQTDYERIRELNNRLENPYKYRVDVGDGDKVESVYLGPVPIYNYDKQYQVISYFSDEGKRLATYNAEDKEINEKIVLRREFRIVSSELKDYRNLIGTRLNTSDEFREGLTDSFLIDVFKARRSEREIRDIVLTIQTNQNKIVDANENNNIVVQGCAGSGKTMVMMHRLSRLQNWVHAFDPKEVLILTPNDQYKTYMKAVTEGLAITSIYQSTIENYYNELIAEINKEMRVKTQILSEQDVKSELLKHLYSQDFIELFDKALKSVLVERRRFISRISKMCAELSIAMPSLDNIKECDYQGYIDTLINNMVSMSNDSVVKFSSIEYEIAALRERRGNILKLGRDEKKKYDAIRSEGQEDMLIRLKRSEELLLKYVADLKEVEKELKEKQEYKDFLHSIIESGELNKQIAEFRKESKEYTPLKIYNATFDAAISDKLKEFKMRKPRGVHRYDLFYRLYFCVRYYRTIPQIHNFICVDEGQDYAPIEYGLLYMLSDGKARFNIFGDLEQGINPGHRIDKWEELNEAFTFEQYELNENYRNSNQITAFCNETFGMDMKPIGINEKDVSELSYEDFIDELKDPAKDTADRWAILIPRTMSKEKIMGDVKNKKISTQHIGSKYIALMYVDEVKGFEFDRVYVFPDTMDDNTKYVAYTRALNELIMVDSPVDTSVPKEPRKYQEYRRKIEKSIVKKRILSKLSADTMRKYAKTAPILVLAANPADKAYISAQFEKADIGYLFDGFDEDETCLTSIYEIDKIPKSCQLMISERLRDTLIDEEHEKLWKSLSERNELIEISTTKGVFGSITTDDEVKRWYLKENKAIFLNVIPEDLDIEDVDYYSEITIYSSGDQYTVISKEDYMEIGSSTDSLKEVLNDLKSKKEISSYPKVISGLAILDVSKKIEIRGIGQLRFEEN